MTKFENYLNLNLNVYWNINIILIILSLHPFKFYSSVTHTKFPQLFKKIPCFFKFLLYFYEKRIYSNFLYVTFVTLKDFFSFNFKYYLKSHYIHYGIYFSQKEKYIKIRNFPKYYRHCEKLFNLLYAYYISIKIPNNFYASLDYLRK